MERNRAQKEKRERLDKCYAKQLGYYNEMCNKHISTKNDQMFHYYCDKVRETKDLMAKDGYDQAEVNDCDQKNLGH